jgi:hypothetical protein
LLQKVGSTGHVTGIDNTAYFIESGKETYAMYRPTWSLIDTQTCFTYDPKEKFDLISGRKGTAMA